jgi:DNA invertase Pin-like site-specific DNA recombinase
MRVWGYARHSPGEKQTIDSQVAAIRDYCQEHGLVLIHIFVDAARKGSTTVGRDGFLAMMDAARTEPRPVDAIIFWAFDRLFRGYDQAQFYKADLRLMGYELISISEAIPEGPVGRLLEAAKDYMAEEELRKNSRAIKRGLGYLRDLGCVPTGYPPVGLRARGKDIGTRPNGETRYGRIWEPDPATWPLVVQAWQMRLRGHTLMEIHNEVNLFQSSQSWSKFFRNEAYLHAGACTPEEWDAVQAIARPYREGGEYPRRKGSPYLLSSPDFATLCAYCGGPISGSRTTYALKDGTRKDWPYYVCAAKKRRWGDCEAKALKANTVDRAVLSTVLDQVLVPEHVIDLVVEVNRILAADLDTATHKTTALQAQLDVLDTSISHLLDAVEADGFQAAQQRLEQRRAERAAVEAELAQLAQQRPTVLHVDEYGVRAAIAEMRHALDTKAAKQVLASLVDRIVLSRDSGELYYHPPLFGSQEPLLRKSLPIAKATFLLIKRQE